MCEIRCKKDELKIITLQNLIFLKFYKLKKWFTWLIIIKIYVYIYVYIYVDNIKKNTIDIMKI